jgi:LysM repeat protein
MDTTGILAGSRIEARITSTEQGELVGHESRQLDEPPAAQQSIDLSPAPTATPIPTETARPTLTHEPAEPTQIRQPTATPTLINRITATLTIPEGNTAFNCEEPPDGWIGYTVQAGDTLSELTVNTGGEIDTVITANCLTDAGRIVVGTTLFLPRRPVRPASTEPDEPTEAVRPPTEVPTRPPQRDQQQRDQQRPTQERDSGGNEGGRGR